MSTPQTALEKCRQFFATGRTQDLRFRASQLQALLRAMEQEENRIMAALQSDLGKPALETYGTEIVGVKLEIRHMLRNLKRWSGRRRISVPWWLWPSSCWAQPEPYGVALILSTWNFPFQLSLMPLIPAITAGNCVVLKPSEHAPHSAELLQEILTKYLEPGFVSVVCGDGKVAAELVELPFDFVFYTGGETIGRRVAEAAGRNLAPCVMELGGKNPSIVEPDAPIDLTGRRIAWAKFLNAGQTCLSPDHVWVHRRIYEPLLAAIKQAILKFYGENPRSSEDFGRIINDRHFQRVSEFLKQGTLYSGGKADADECYIEPTLLTDIPPDSPVLTEEIFGPILPVLPYDDLNALLKDLARKPAPLALYLHTRDRAIEEKVLRSTRSGSVCVNEHIMHVTVLDLPFGGSGASGMGRYHGRSGFETFSQQRGVMRYPWFLDNPLRYPPGKSKLQLVKRLIG